MSSTEPIYGDRRAALAPILVLAALVALANAFKPVHIDDTLYVRIAERILENPADPFGGTINWQHIPQKAYEVSISPPLLSYYLAAVMALFGKSPLVLHAAMTPWVLLLAWSLVSWSRRFGATDAPAWLTLGAPAAAVGANLMLDVPLTACLTAACATLWNSVDEGRWKPLLVAGLWGSAAVLLKFPGAVFAVVCVTLAVTKRRWGPLLPAAMCAGALFAWQSWSQAKYGAGQLQQATDFLQRFHGEALRSTTERLLQAFALVGMTFPIWIVSFVSGTQRRWGIAIGAGAAGAAYWLLPNEARAAPAFGAAFVTSVFLGAFGVSESLLGCWVAGRLRTSVLPILALIAGVVGMTIVGAPFVAVRYFLPIQPALGIMVCARPGVSVWAMRATIAVSLIVSTLLAWTDRVWAASYRTATAEIAQKYAGRNVVFAGHWGWQYYMEERGFTAWDARKLPPVGSLLVVPERADAVRLNPSVQTRLRLVETLEFPVGVFGFTVWELHPRGDFGVRFYGGGFPHLAWGFSAKSERMAIYEVVL